MLRPGERPRGDGIEVQTGRFLCCLADYLPHEGSTTRPERCRIGQGAASSLRHVEGAVDPVGPYVQMEHPANSTSRSPSMADRYNRKYPQVAQVGFFCSKQLRHLHDHCHRRLRIASHQSLLVTQCLAGRALLRARCLLRGLILGLSTWHHMVVLSLQLLLVQLLGLQNPSSRSKQASSLPLRQGSLPSRPPPQPSRVKPRSKSLSWIRN